MKKEPNFFMWDRSVGTTDAELESLFIQSGNENLIPLLHSRDPQCRFDIDIANNCRYFSIRAFSLIHRIKLDRYESLPIRHASIKICKEQGLGIFQIEAYRGTKLNMYPESVLGLVFFGLDYELNA